MRLVLVFQSSSFELCLDLGKRHRGRFGAVDILIVFAEVEGLPNRSSEVIVNYAVPIVKYLVRRRHCGDVDVED